MWRGHLARKKVREKRRSVAKRRSRSLSGRGGSGCGGGSGGSGGGGSGASTLGDKGRTQTSADLLGVASGGSGAAPALKRRSTAGSGLLAPASPPPRSLEGRRPPVEAWATPRGERGSGSSSASHRGEARGDRAKRRSVNFGA